MTTSASTPAIEKFLLRARKPLTFHFALWWQVPNAFWSGVRLRHIDPEKAVASVPFKRFTQNPFRSTYFACLSMAAELSCAILAVMVIEGAKPSVSMLITQVNGDFVKKATSRTYFTCEEGLAIAAAAQRAQLTGEAVDYTASTIGRNEKGEEIARFQVRLSFKVRNEAPRT